MLTGQRDILPGDPVHAHRQHGAQVALAQRLERSLVERAVVLFVLHQQIARLPRQIAEGAGEHHGLDAGIPIVGGIELDLDVAEAVAVQHQCSIPECAGGIHRRLDVAADFEEAVGVDALVVLAGVDGECGVALGDEARAQEADRRRGVVRPAAVHLDDERRRLRRLAARLPQRRIDPVAIDRRDGEEFHPFEKRICFVFSFF